MELNQQVKIDSDNNTVAGILAKALQESEIGYVFNNNYISLYKKPADVIAEVPQQSKRQISGKIVDSMGMSIIGANILEKGIIVPAYNFSQLSKPKFKIDIIPAAKIDEAFRVLFK